METSSQVNKVFATNFDSTIAHRGTGQASEIINWPLLRSSASVRAASAGQIRPKMLMVLA